MKLVKEHGFGLYFGDRQESLGHGISFPELFKYAISELIVYFSDYAFLYISAILETTVGGSMEDPKEKWPIQEFEYRIPLAFAIVLAAELGLISANGKNINTDELDAEKEKKLTTFFMMHGEKKK